MQDSTANDFYERIVEGTKYKKEIDLEHGSGAKLEGVVMRPVNKQVLASVIQALPEEMFEAVEDADSADEAEEMLDGDGGGSLAAMSSETVSEFEKLCKESLSHPELTSKQMEAVVDALGFEMLFELGGDIMDMSFSDSGAIKDFQERQ
jgi:hypothetical protein